MLGFWLKGNGYNNPSGYTYYSYLNSQINNPDGYKHCSWARIDDVVMMGFEDLYGLGDRVRKCLAEFTANCISYLYFRATGL